jgi:hypothetical protein
LGLTSCSDLKEILYPVRTTAVCIPPGARLRLRDIPEHLQQSLAVRAVEEVIFIEQRVESFPHRDAVRFANGREILLQYLQCGQRVEVLDLCLASAADRVDRTQEAEDQLAFAG